MEQKPHVTASTECVETSVEQSDGRLLDRDQRADSKETRLEMRLDHDRYMKTQPTDKRKLGFGTHDASTLRPRSLKK